MKTKRIIAMMVIICMMLAVSLPVSAYGSLPEGQAVQTSYISADSTEFMVPVESLTEVPEGYIGIYTAEDLDNIRNDLSANYILMNDIDMSTYGMWTPIGVSYLEPFAGTFNGNGYYIKNISILMDDKFIKSIGNSCGVFGFVFDCYIHDLGIINEQILIDINTETYTLYIGGIAGYSGSSTNNTDSSTISNCVCDCYIYSDGIAGSLCYIGGISGYSGTRFSNIRCKGGIYTYDVTAHIYVGGVIGVLSENTFDNCINAIDIYVTSNNSITAGGIIGQCKSAISNTINFGSINAITSSANSSDIASVGGIVGSCNSSSLYNCKNIGSDLYSSAIDAAESRIGGIIGSSSLSTAEYCFNLSKIESHSNYGYLFIGGILSIDNSANNNVDNCENCGDLSGSSENAEVYMGGIAGIFKSSISNCDNKGKISSELSKRLILGGIVGDLYNNASIQKSYNHGVIDVNSNYSVVGGIVGYNRGEIGLSYNLADITVYGSNRTISGGIIGESTTGGSTSNCYNTGNINSSSSGNVYAGGIGGYIYYGSEECCYNIGNIITSNTSDGKTYAGGIAGHSSNKNYMYYSSSAVILGEIISIKGTALSLSELCTPEALQGFDFDTIWEIGVTEGYPYPTLRENPHIVNIIVPETPVTTTFDTTEITLSERDTYSFEGLVSTTSENGLKDLQINITNAETGIGIKYFRIENIGSGEFDLSEVPSFTAGTTLTGKDQLDTEQNLELIAGTSWKIQIFATDNDGNSLGDNIIKQINISDPTDITTSVSCQNLEDYAGNYRDFTVTFSSLPDSAYLQFDNQYAPAEWLSDEYCSTNVLFNISLNDIRETDGQYVYTTEFRIHSEGLATENYMRKVRVVAYYSGTKIVSEPLSFQVIPIPTEAYGNRIGYQYLQITPTEEITENPIIHTVTNSTGADGSRILSVINYDCHASGVPFFWWETDCGTFYEISDDFTTVGFVPDGSGSVTVYMGDGLGNVASYVLKING